MLTRTNNTTKYMATNFESLIMKMDELQLSINEFKPDNIFGSEIWLKSDIDECIVNVSLLTDEASQNVCIVLSIIYKKK